MMEMLPPLSEADIKRAIDEYLQYAENQGRLLFHRLNAGDFIVLDPDGSHRRRVKGQKKGCADYLVLQGGFVQTAYKGELKGQPQPVCFNTYIEVKSATGEQSPAQKEFEIQVKKHHCQYHIVRDVSQLEEVLFRR